MSERNVLVTGATGFIGRHVVKTLLQRGFAVRAVARDLEKARTLPWFADVEFVAADIHAPDTDVRALTEGVDAMLHLAWPGLPDYAGLFHFETTLPADYAFIKAVVESGVTQVLVTGTCFEYGLQSGPLSEASPPQPANPYGLAKNTLRLFLEALNRTQPFTLQWARLFYLHGEGQNPRSLLASLDRAIAAGDTHFNMSKGEDARGPWNEGGDWEFVEDPQPAVDGGDGLATVGVNEADVAVLQAMASRTASDPEADPVTGADLGSGQAVK